ncbi:SigB/SigF/SigG family RNA polymerase sigma factor [Streptomyces sp. AJS327]|uniref:SigB/SigF/SigG family RNA polymerase sigma factor n=1 Tax=Streptomyces sp. AJS327 TaxID=2545265 RepID=UPI0015E03D67|nr:SigB/SigF/SigG family RNA polymerase sigma factor [Streptomyces sp. AJS327]MBA0049431.1 SigB/SigF/SigG family RNA polymerase sigma factor [Streptomyces sp. AJS327]
MATTGQSRPRARRSRHSHHDAPDTAADFARLERLPDGAEKRRLQQEVAAAWLPMAYRLARKYRNRGEALEDLEQIAALALVKAVEGYNPSRGCAFESYAIPTIYGELKRHFRDNLWDVHVPRRVQNLRNRVRVSMQDLSGGSRAPTVAQLAEHARLSEEDVQLGLEALHGFSSLSLDAEVPGADNGYSLLDSLSVQEADYEHVIDREAVKSRLRCLPEREQYILYLRFFREMTQSGIARQLGISQMHVSRLIAGACRRVREEIDGDQGGEPDDPGPPVSRDSPSPPGSPVSPRPSNSPRTPETPGSSPTRGPSGAPGPPGSPGSPGAPDAPGAAGPAGSRGSSDASAERGEAPGPHGHP